MKGSKERRVKRLTVITAMAQALLASRGSGAADQINIITAADPAKIDAVKAPMSRDE